MTAEPRYVITPQPSGEFRVQDCIAEHAVAIYTPSPEYPGIPTAQQLAEHLAERLNHLDKQEHQRHAYVAAVQPWLNQLSVSDLEDFARALQKSGPSATFRDICYTQFRD